MNQQLGNSLFAFPQSARGRLAARCRDARRPIAAALDQASRGGDRTGSAAAPRTPSRLARRRVELRPSASRPPQFETRIELVIFWKSRLTAEVMPGPSEARIALDGALTHFGNAA